MKIVWLLICSCLVAGAANAQRYTRTDNGISALVNDINIEVRWYSPTIVQIIKSPAGHTYKKGSLSVIASPETVNLQIQQEGDRVDMRSGVLRVGVSLQTGKVVFDDSTGTRLLTEKDYGTQF